MLFILEKPAFFPSISLGLSVEMYLKEDCLIIWVDFLKALTICPGDGAD